MPYLQLRIRLPLPQHFSERLNHISLRWLRQSSTRQATCLPRVELMAQLRFGTSEVAMSPTLSTDMEVLYLPYVYSSSTPLPPVWTIRSQSGKESGKAVLMKTKR